MRVSVNPRHRNSRRDLDGKRVPQFLAWLRGRACVFHALGDCDGKIEAMHLDFAGGKGVASKVADRYCLPACAAHHRMQHAKGWHTFMRLAGVTPTMLLDAADRFWRAWPGRAAWEKKVEERNG